MLSVAGFRGPHVLFALGDARGARAIQELARHADFTMTQRYMHLNPSATEEAIRLRDGRQSGLETVETFGGIWRRAARRPCMLQALPLAAS